MAPKENEKRGKYNKPPLTPTEQALLGNIRSRRLSAKELAALIGTSESAIRTQMSSLKKKFPGQVSVRWGLGYMFTGEIPREDNEHE